MSVAARHRRSSLNAIDGVALRLCLTRAVRLRCGVNIRTFTTFGVAVGSRTAYDEHVGVDDVMSKRKEAHAEPS